MKERQYVAVLCGGRSPEHEISLCSAWNLVNAVDRDRFRVLLIGIDKHGRWWLQDEEAFLAQQPFAGSMSLTQSSEPLAVVPGNAGSSLYNIEKGVYLDEIAVVFPMIHGPNCEDGSMQGLLRQLNLPFVGPGVLSSAICMDKDIAKRLMQQAGIPTSRFVSCTRAGRHSVSFEEISNELNLPLFVKPANMGSSVGVAKVDGESSFYQALDEAFRYDNKIVIEEFVDGREIECAVLGNEGPVSSVPGQYVHADEFFAYDTKYLKGQEVTMEIPAHDMDEEMMEAAKNLALRTYSCLQCEGLARVDIFLTADGRFLVNEVNTLPGFTNSSMYPGLMGSAGIPYTELVTRLIDLAIERHAGRANFSE
jgi:D-alanine-D-alanine ligase